MVVDRLLSLDNTCDERSTTSGEIFLSPEFGQSSRRTWEGTQDVYTLILRDWIHKFPMNSRSMTSRRARGEDNSEGCSY